jgi:large subunit ribosomal protein L32e
MISNLLEIRKELKERKPIFIRQDNPKRMKLNDKWRKPKGIHSKIRHKFKGRRKMPSPGYKSPRDVKGLHASGLKIVNVSSIDDVKNIKKESEGIVISKSVGMKKRFEILKKAKELNILILNLNIDEQIKKIEDFINSKKKKEIKEIKKEEKKESIKEQKPAKEQKESVVTDKEKKETEKKEKDKVLTKKV